MLERSSEIDDLARRIFLAQHFCSRDIQAPAATETVAEARTWMVLNDFDQAPLAESNGERVILRAELDDQPLDRCVGELATPTPQHHCLDADAPLRDALDLLAERNWLLVRHQGKLIGILTRHDLASPVVTTYLLALLLGLEQGLRRLYGSYAHNPIPDEPEDPQATEHPLSLSKLIRLVATQSELRAALGFSSRRSFDNATGGIVALRNTLAHGRSILGFTPDLQGAMQRIRLLEHLMQRVRDLLADREHVWDVFAATQIVELSSHGPVVWAGAEAGPLSLVAPVHVISAQNPREQVLSTDENKMRHRLLFDYLSLYTPAFALHEVEASSTQGSWSESSWATAGLDREAALAIARRFQQRAIFELTESTVSVIDAEGAIRRQTSRKWCFS